MDTIQFTRLLKDHINKINPSFGKFVLEYPIASMTSKVKIKHGDDLIAIVQFLEKTHSFQNGRRSISSVFAVRWRNDSRWYNEKSQEPYIFVNEFGKSWNNDNLIRRIPFEQMLNEILPIENDSEKVRIKEVFEENNIEIEGIAFNTSSKKYQVKLNLRKYIGDKWKKNKLDVTLCKYMSLSSFMQMLKNKTFRMNSIVSMNDSTECFAFGKLLGENIEKISRYRSIVENKNVLITSFSSLYDNALMWRLYGDNGRGVCLSFSYNTQLTKLLPIFYVNEMESKVQVLRNIVDKLKEDDITIYMEQENELKYYVKSSQFDYEKEYRLVHFADKKDLRIEKYGDLISFYQDFKIDNKGRVPEIGINIRSVIIGKNLPFFDVNYPLLVDMINSTFHVENIDVSDVDSIRL